MRLRCLLLALPLIAVLRAAPAAEPPPRSPTAAVKPQPTPAIAHCAPSTPPTELNLRQLGAIGDNQPHPVSEWIAAKKYKNLHDIQRDYPFVTSLDWSADEAAFQRALKELPPEGGTIRIPAGRYIATAYGWRIDRDHVRLSGAGMRDTMLSTGPKLDTGLVLAPDPGEGWQLGADKEYPFAPDSGAFDTDKLRLREPARAAEFKAGDLVFIRNGACGFDQDFGEFNEIVSTTPEGDLVLKHPLARDYTVAALNWANETAEPLTIPKPGKSVTVRVRTGDTFTPLPSSGTITVGDALLEIVRSTAATITLRNPAQSTSPNGGTGSRRGVARDALQESPGPDDAQNPTGVSSDAPATERPSIHLNPPPGTVLPAGTKIAKSRTITRVSRTTRDFSATGLRIVARRTALVLSNSYESKFIDCDFARRPDATTPAGGLTLVGITGRFAEFRRCTFRSSQPAPAQLARSFGNVAFTDCTFVSTNIAFTEFAFAGTLDHCQLQIPAALGHAILVGSSCGDLRIENSTIVVTGGVIPIFDATTDIQQRQTAPRPSRLVIRDNRITGSGTLRPLAFKLLPGRIADITGNTLNNAPVEPPAASVQHP